MRDDVALPRCAPTRAPPRLQRNNVQCLRDLVNRQKQADLPAFSLVWENRHSYLDIRNGALHTHLKVRVQGMAQRCVGALHRHPSARSIAVIGRNDRRLSCRAWGFGVRNWKKAEQDTIERAQGNRDAALPIHNPE
ncbi:hypothetical protein [Xanthomonas sp. D-109]|uniref:hypothetical protein n=1 Tax=Xanthomonas sp. D-109 TaxID=2821274 RepID=UPI001ADA40EA|nr:hypothetical protein [Xanthomonas sp. D-109]MBO9880812.1 hypothetical protein [Xanthomonas sp. D-109]